MQHDPSREIPCTEMAANAFNYALRLDPDNEGAKHMLASVTADATMKRASNEYVKELFEDYAGKYVLCLRKDTTLECFCDCLAIYVIRRIINLCLMINDRLFVPVIHSFASFSTSCHVKYRNQF